jgi:hypothetical protein
MPAIEVKDRVAEHPYRSVLANFGDSIPNSRKHQIKSNLFPELPKTLSETIEFEDQRVRSWPKALVLVIPLNDRSVSKDAYNCSTTNEHYWCDSSRFRNPE